MTLRYKLFGMPGNLEEAIEKRKRKGIPYADSLSLYYYNDRNYLNPSAEFRAYLRIEFESYPRFFTDRVNLRKLTFKGGDESCLKSLFDFSIQEIITIGQKLKKEDVPFYINNFMSFEDYIKNYNQGNYRVLIKPEPWIELKSWNDAFHFH
jgi:hypothetical protein